MIQKAAKSLKENGFISTSIPALDKACGGGFPLRRVTLLSGAYSMGKSTIAQLAVASAQQAGMNVLWYDAESSADLVYMEACGIDLKKLDLLQAPYAEAGLQEIMDYVEKGNALVVIDSIGALVTKEQVEKQMEEMTIGAQARVVSRFLAKICPLLALKDSAMVCITHESVNITTGTVEAAGGKKLTYATSLYIQLKARFKNGILKSGDNIVGKVIVAKIKKNKIAPTENSEADLHYVYVLGFQKNTSLLDDAIDAGIVVKNKASFEWANGERWAYGQSAAREMLENPEFVELLKSKLEHAKNT
jgi:recombination protein RecA